MGRLGGFVLIVCGLLLFGWAAPAHAEFTENTIGCAGSAVVHGDDGSATSVNADDSSVTLEDTSGNADYTGSVATVTHNHFGEINLEFGPAAIQVGDWGPSKNASNQNSKNGNKDLPSALSNIPPGKYDLNGFHQGDEGRCAGEMTVEVAGSILSSPISLATSVLAALALLLFLFGALRGKPVLGALAGLFLGLFGGLDLVFGRVLSSSSILILILPVALLVVGLVVGFLQRPGTPAGPPPTPA
jgi:hypothetical protein